MALNLYVQFLKPEHEILEACFWYVKVISISLGYLM